MIKKILDSKKKIATRRKLVIVGNGMVSHRLCKQLISHPEYRDLLEVVVLGGEPHPAYDRVNLTKLITLKEPEALYLDRREWYAEHDIVLHTGVNAEQIDFARREIKTNNSQVFTYDLLVLATGSTPFVPPVQGIDDDKVFVYRTIQDVEAIVSAAKTATRGVVIGGGLLGLEAARALFDEGLDEVHVVEMANFLMPQQLDERAGLILKEELDKQGLITHLGRRLERIERKDSTLSLSFRDGRSLQTDMVVISAGIRPATSFLADTDLLLNPVGAVRVDDKLHSNLPGVYAIGECADHQGIIYGLVKPGYEMADALAKGLLGKKARFESGDTSTRLKISGIDVAILGDSLQADPQSHAVTFTEMHGVGQSLYRKLILYGNRLIGVIALGPWDDLTLLQSYIDRGQKLSSKQIELFKETGSPWQGQATPSIGDWSDSTTICNCMRVNKGDLVAAMEGGCQNADDLAACTGASTVCGSCRPLLEVMTGAPIGPSRLPVAARILIAASIFACGAMLLLCQIPGVTMANTVEAASWKLEQLWRNGIMRQVTGYTLLAFSLLAGLLSLRKRIKWLEKLGQFGSWRALHGTAGLLTLVTLFAHTGFHFGANLNFCLMLTFSILNLLGAFAGLAAGLEPKVNASIGQLARKLRPIATWAHIIVFWPLPLLITTHIFSVYYY